jgi:hypothetical protein
VVRILSVALKNEPGALAHVATALGNAGLNIEAVLGDAHTELGVARLLVDDPDEGQRVLEEAGHPAQMLEGVRLEMGNRPGELGRALQELGRVDVNVELMFGGAPDPERGEVVFVVDDPERARKVLDGD